MMHWSTFDSIYDVFNHLNLNIEAQISICIDCRQSQSVKYHWRLCEATLNTPLTSMACFILHYEFNSSTNWKLPHHQWKIVHRLPKQVKNKNILDPFSAWCMVTAFYESNTFFAESNNYWHEALWYLEPVWLESNHLEIYYVIHIIRTINLKHK